MLVRIVWQTDCSPLAWRFPTATPDESEFRRRRSSDPGREEYTICTAVAPDAVRTVRTYATTPL
jgi:hypothetical protein